MLPFLLFRRRWHCWPLKKKKEEGRKTFWKQCVKILSFFMKISGGKLAGGMIQCWARWVGVLRKRCLRGFFGLFLWKPLELGIDCPGPQVWAVRAQAEQGCVEGALWDFLAGGMLVAKGEDQQFRLGQHLSRRDPSGQVISRSVKDEEQELDLWAACTPAGCLCFPHL